jgi:hypothetical protein
MKRKIKLFLSFLLFLTFTWQVAFAQIKLTKSPLPINAPVMATAEYCTGFDFNDYSTTLDSHPSWGTVFVREQRWSQHPIIWKHLVSTLNFNPQQQSFPFSAYQGMGSLNLWPNVSDQVNQYEASGGAFTDDQGNAVNPTGTWFQAGINDPNTAAIFSAMMIWGWATPVYTNWRVDSQNSNGDVVESRVAVIRCVTLSHPNGRPDSACNWSAAGATDVLNQISNCPDLVVESVKMDLFLKSDFVDVMFTGQEYVDKPQLTGSQFVQEFIASGNAAGFPGHDFMFDPPEVTDGYGAVVEPELAVQRLLNSSRIQATQSLLRAPDKSLLKLSGSSLSSK